MNYSHYIALFIILILVPVVLIGAWIKVNKRKKVKSILRKKFEDFAIRNNLTIDKKQIVRENVIGIDRMNFKLVFLNTETSKDRFRVIDMENILGCNLNKERDESTGHISKISLQCVAENVNPDIHFVFYDENKDDLITMMRSFKKASYWKKCIDIFTESANLSVRKGERRIISSAIVERYLEN